MKLNKLKFIILLVIFILFININTCFANAKNLNILSPSVLLLDSSSGAILYEKNAHEKLYPASTTKIMTAILTLEYCKLTDVVTVSSNAIYSVPNGYSHANLVEGEELTIEQLLHVLLIPSANDAANVLAEHIAGSIESFCSMMNSKAIELGCECTNFKNPSGIHDDEHTSCAYDLGLMGKCAMQNPTFRKIVSETRYTLPKTNKYFEENRIFNTTNELLKVNYSSRANNYYYENAIGMKTGYTVKANQCIVAAAKKNDVEVIAVVLNGSNTENGLSSRFLDCKTLFNYAFSNYSALKICEENDVISAINISNATKNTKNLNLVASNSIHATVNNDSALQDIPKQITLKDKLKAPIAKGEVLGSVTYTVNDKTYSSNLVAESDVLVSNFVKYVFTYLFLFMILLILISLLKPKKRRRKKKYKNAKYAYYR